MAALKSIEHERFYRAVLSNINAGQPHIKAQVTAYIETMYRGDNPGSIAVQANSRRLSNRPEVKAPGRTDPAGIHADCG
jgi:hypothetical protein